YSRWPVASAARRPGRTRADAPQPRGRRCRAGPRPAPNEHCPLGLHALGVKAGEQVAGHLASRGARGVSSSQPPLAQRANSGKPDAREREDRTMTGFRRYIVVGCTALGLAAAVLAGAGTLRCPPNSVKVGTNCIDTYEASVWRVPDPTTINRSLVAK